MRKDWWVPLTGVGFLVLAIVSFAVAGEPESADEGARKVVEHYKDNKDAIMAGSFIGGASLVLFIYFMGYLRKVLRAAEPPDGMLSGLVLVGATIIATGLAVDMTITLAISEAVDDVNPTSILALQALWDNDFLPMAVGTLIVTTAAGISILRYGALPKWMGWFLILLTVLGLTPIGFAAFVGTGVWILIASVYLTMRNRSAPATA